MHSKQLLSFSHNLQLSIQIKQLFSDMNFLEKQSEHFGVELSNKEQYSHPEPQKVQVFCEFIIYPGSQLKHSTLFVS